MSTFLRKLFDEKHLDEQELHLPLHGLFRLSGESAVNVQVTSGLIWATSEGEDQDLFLSKGAKKQLRGRNLVLEAIDGPSTLCVSGK